MKQRSFTYYFHLFISVHFESQQAYSVSGLLVKEGVKFPVGSGPVSGLGRGIVNECIFDLLQPRGK
jgi:hypothetical protein